MYSPYEMFYCQKSGWALWNKVTREYLTPNGKWEARGNSCYHNDINSLLKMAKETDSNFNHNYFCAGVPLSIFFD